MASPVIPPKTPSLSNLMGNGSLAAESSPHYNATPIPTCGGESNRGAENPQPTQKSKVRPPLAPKPKLSPERKESLSKPVLRDRAKSVSALQSPERKHSHDLKPPVLPRLINVRTPPPKPPRRMSSVFSDDKMEDEESSISNITPAQVEGAAEATRSGDSEGVHQNHLESPYEEEYDDFASHVPVFRTVSHSLPTQHTQQHSWELDPIAGPQHGLNVKETVESYHEIQAKHLPLFKSMTLTELAKRYAKYFPIKIQVTEGHYGMSSKYSISTDDRLNLHFKKRMKQVTIQTYGEEYFIPLSSAIQFGLVYDPSDNQTVAIEGHRFRRVADLIGANPLPRLVRVMSSCSCSNGVFLEYNELLVVKKVKKSLFRGKPMLKVFSLLTMTKKLLPEAAIGDFTTKPLCLKMNLPQFLEHIPKPFPSKAMMYLEKDRNGASYIDEEELPPYMFSWPVTLKEVRKHKSLVATPEKSLQLIDIPLYGNIAAVKANIVPPNSPEDIQELFINTQRFLHRFDVTKVDIYGDFHTETAYDAQNTLYRIVRGSIKGLGIEVVTPEALRKLHMDGHHHMPVETGNDSDSFTSSSSGSHIYATLPGHLGSDEDYELLEQVRPVFSSASTAPDLLENRPLEINRDLPIPIPRKPPVTPRKRSETSLSGSGVFRYPRRRASLAPQSEHPLTGGHRSASLVQLASVEMTTEELEENREYIKSLSISQVSACIIPIRV